MVFTRYIYITVQQNLTLAKKKRKGILHCWHTALYLQNKNILIFYTSFEQSLKSRAATT